MKTIKYFSAKWCGPCRTFKPIMQEIAGEGSVIVKFIDIDQEQNKAKNYNIRSVPTTVIEESGIEVDRFVGVIPKRQVLQKLM
jgi:thioredoxin 1|tara:strand:- start:621 stop:869 length:249 start_codon:yes stop_codon:yes gene_type:complete